MCVAVHVLKRTGETGRQTERESPCGPCTKEMELRGTTEVQHPGPQGKLTTGSLDAEAPGP